MQKTTVTANIKKNRLYFTIVGRLTKKELDSLYTDVRFCVADLQPGFDVITDLSKCTLTSLAGLPTFLKIAHYLISSQVGHVVRVINDNSLLFRQALNFAAKFQGYETTNVTTMEEAEETLNLAAKRDGLRLKLNVQSVTYTADGLNGEGRIANISTSGCAIHEASEQVAQGDELTLSVAFEAEDDTEITFTIKGCVVRSDADEFAVQFLDLEEEQKQKLWKCLMRETQKEISF